MTLNHISVYESISPAPWDLIYLCFYGLYYILESTFELDFKDM